MIAGRDRNAKALLVQKADVHDAMIPLCRDARALARMLPAVLGLCCWAAGGLEADAQSELELTRSSQGISS